MVATGHPLSSSQYGPGTAPHHPTGHAWTAAATIGGAGSHHAGPSPGSGRPTALREGGDDVAPVGLELGFLVAIHEIQVELVDAGLGELVQLGDVLLRRPEQAEPVGHLVADEGRIGRSDLRVMEVV